MRNLYPGRDTFEFDQGHVTKNQPITVLIFLSESYISYITIVKYYTTKLVQGLIQ